MLRRSIDAKMRDMFVSRVDCSFGGRASCGLIDAHDGKCRRSSGRARNDPAPSCEPGFIIHACSASTSTCTLGEFGLWQITMRHLKHKS